MSEEIYRIKTEWDKYKITKTIDTRNVPFFNYNDETYELGFNMFDLYGHWFRIEDGTAFMGEILYEDIEECIHYLENNEIPFGDEIKEKVIKDFTFMKMICENEDIDWFEVYII